MRIWTYALFASILLVLAACASPGYYSQPPVSQRYYPSYSDVPPSFYNYDPTLMHWYTMPYWNPEQGP